MLFTKRERGFELGIEKQQPASVEAFDWLNGQFPGDMYSQMERSKVFKGKKIKTSWFTLAVNSLLLCTLYKRLSLVPFLPLTIKRDFHSGWHVFWNIFHRRRSCIRCSQNQDVCIKAHGMFLQSQQLSITSEMTGKQNTYSKKKQQWKFCFVWPTYDKTWNLWVIAVLSSFKI